jgi:haloalkane dehalogenase
MERPPWVDHELFPFTSRFIDVGGHTVHYIDEGSGPTLLFLHGNPTWSFVYRDVIRQLRDQFRCVALDYPGFGLSSPGPGTSAEPSATGNS